MKYALLIISAIVVFSACKKKQDDTHCYYCNRIDSVATNIPKLAEPNVMSGEFELCQYSENRKNLYIRDHTSKDTSYFSNDTLVVKYKSVTCNLGL
jgi:hypothetical protein